MVGHERGDDLDRLGELVSLDRHDEQIDGGGLARRGGCVHGGAAVRIDDGEGPVDPIDPDAVPRQPLRPVTRRDEGHVVAGVGEVHGIHHAHGARADDGDGADLSCSHPAMLGRASHPTA